MTNKQNEVIELMKRLGSKGHVIVRGDSVRVSLPFAEDKNPNITVWPNGAWRDFSGTTNAAEWEKLGLLEHGYLLDLQEAFTNRFPKMWNELHDVFDQEHLDYVNKRNIRWKSLKLLWGALAFPIVDFDENVIGIQTRRIDGGEPKNMMVHGSDGKNGMFIGHREGANIPVLICEGATDTYTEVFGVCQVGCISSSMLSGLKTFLNRSRDVYSEFILALDADEAGRNAQGELLGYMLSIGIPREKIFLMVHTEGNKDLNDEMCNHHSFKSEPINTKSSDIFVKVVDEVVPEMEKAIWIDFWPPDFPKMKHSHLFQENGGKGGIFVFPESYGRAAINKLMWLNRTSAYILRGF